MINFLFKNFESYKDKTSVFYQGIAYSYLDIYKYVDKVSQYLIDFNFMKGDRLVLLGENSIEFLVTIFAINNIGGIFVILDSKSTASKLKYIFDDISAHIILVDDDILMEKNFLIESSFNNIIKTSNLFSDTLKYKKYFILKYNQDQNDIASVIYTSGSTGFPKGVVSLNKNIKFSVNEINNILNYDYNDIILNGLNISFDYGLYQIFLSFNVGATIILERNFDKLFDFPSLLYKYRVTIFPVVPTIINTLLLSKLLERIDLPYLKSITSTGDFFHISTIKKLKDIFPNIDIFPMYGITECKRVSIMPRGMLDSKLGSVGKPLENIEVYLDDNGQLIVSGDNVMSGYWNETKKDIKGDTYFDFVNGKRVLYTGDYFRKDNDDFLYFLGRKDDIVKINSKRINLKEIENFLIDKLESVKEIAVKYTCENLFIFIFSEKELLKDLIVILIKQEFFINIKKRNIFFQKTYLPKNSNGKIDKNKLLNNYGLLSGEDDILSHTSFI